MPWARRPNCELVWSIVMKSARICGSSPYFRRARSLMERCCSSASTCKVRIHARSTSFVSDSASLRTSARARSCSERRVALWACRLCRSASSWILSERSSAFCLRSAMLVLRARITAETAAISTTTRIHNSGSVIQDVMRLSSSRIAGGRVGRAAVATVAGLAPRCGPHSQANGFSSMSRRTVPSDACMTSRPAY
ncbi:hypothetical protein CF54_19230 [Streptomyces sp. Tu 6176]|nr:hypothetical protein CF54_19230 [Streptomyces sp. Tu 6176]